MNLFLRKLIISFCIIPFLFSCQKEKQNQYVLDGMVQGSYYHIVYYSTETENKNISKDIDSIFLIIHNSVSLWAKSSIINKVNNNIDVQLDSIFIDCYNSSKRISELTSGALDCTVGGLVEIYGFSSKNKEKLSDKLIDSLREYVNYKNIRVEDKKLIKKYNQTKIDFNAIAQGYTTDKVSNYFLSKGIENFIVDIGGEVRANGKKDNGSFWHCAIEQPSDSSSSESKFNVYIDLKNNSIATSGNYRTYYIDEKGVKKSHTIDPKTGRSVNHSLLSVSVIAKNATIADGLATSFMVMGLEKSKEFLIKHQEIQAYFIYSDSNNKLQTYLTPNLKLSALNKIK